MSRGRFGGKSGTSGRPYFGVIPDRLDRMSAGRTGHSTGQTAHVHGAGCGPGVEVSRRISLCCRFFGSLPSEFHFPEISGNLVDFGGKSEKIRKIRENPGEFSGFCMAANVNTMEIEVLQDFGATAGFPVVSGNLGTQKSFAPVATGHLPQQSSDTKFSPRCSSLLQGNPMIVIMRNS